MSTLNTYESTVNSFYLAFYGRPADPAGMKYWALQLAASNGDLAAITVAFATSAETQARFGSAAPADRIAEIYQQLFNHKPDAAGLAYWTDVVEQGHASLADVSIAILKGSQGSDQSLVALRQKAVDAFTAQVEATGAKYDGYASIEAARVLVRAVTAGATEADLDVLVKAAVSFADTATKTPKVVEAIATGSTLLNLFDTARGTGDPVSLAQALADTAKAAAGDPATLQSLLRDGGMNQVLKVMPAAATLKDVVDALAKGGLPAAVEVVYPTAPVTPPVVIPPAATMKITFKGVEQHIDDISIDNVTNVGKAKIEFSLNKALGANEKVQYSLDGTQWTDKGLSLTNAGNGRIVTIADVDLTMGTPVDALPPPRMAEGSSIMGAIGNSNLATKVYVRVVVDNDSLVTSESQVIEFDGQVATLQAYFPNAVNDSRIDTNGQLFVNSPVHELFNQEQGARIYYKPVEMVHGRVASTPIASIADLEQNGWSTKAPAFSQDDYYQYDVRQVDVSGNISDATRVSFVLDTKKPNVPQIKLAADTGASATDGITSNGTIEITGLDAGTRTGWEYSTDQGKTWEFGGVNGYSGKAELVLTKPATEKQIDLLVRQFDAAGNIGKESDGLTFTLDTIAPQNTLSFIGLEGGAAGVYRSEQDSTVLTMTFNAAADEQVEWRVKGSNTEWQTATATGLNAYSTGSISLLTSDPTIEVRVVDQAGNASGTVEQAIDGKYGDLPPPPPPPAPTAGITGFALTGSPSVVYMSASAGEIVSAAGEGNAGLLNRGGLYLETFSGGTYRATADNYLDGESFGMLNGGMLRFDDQLQTGLYRINWLDNVIATTQMPVSQGMQLFAGGARGFVLQEGFAVSDMRFVGANIGVDPVDTTSYAYSSSSWTEYTIFTGSGHDVIIDEGGTLNIGYRAFTKGAQDLIIGFDAGHDKIRLYDEAATRIDANFTGTIDWAGPAVKGQKAVIGGGTEAVEIVIADFLSTESTQSTVDALNFALDLSAMRPNGNLLILAKAEDSASGILYHFVDANGDRLIDSNELTSVAAFDGGAPVQTDIIVVGTALP